MNGIHVEHLLIALDRGHIGKEVEIRSKLLNYCRFVHAKRRKIGTQGHGTGWSL